MATLYITECNQIASIPNAYYAMAPCMPPAGEQKLSITTTSTASNTFSVNTYFLMLETDATCSLAFSSAGTTVSATTSAHRMAAGEVRFYGVNPGATVAVVTNT